VSSTESGELKVVGRKYIEYLPISIIERGFATRVYPRQVCSGGHEPNLRSHRAKPAGQGHGGTRSTLRTLSPQPGTGSDQARYAQVWELVPNRGYCLSVATTPHGALRSTFTLVGAGEDMAREAGTKKQRDQLRAAMTGQGCTLEQIAAEMARRFGFRARPAWRHTYGWTQGEVAAAYNRLLDNDQAPMTGKRISDFEAWPAGGVKPTPTTLAVLARIYGTTPSTLVDLDDRHALNTQELIALDALNTHKPPSTPAVSHPPAPQPSNTLSTTGNTAQNPTPADASNHTTPPDLDTPTTVLQPEPIPEEKISPQRRRWSLILASLLAITVTLGGAVLAQCH
jgi:hypothetical protein